MSDDDDDCRSDPNEERPSVKKPRYVWQIQGLCSLRQDGSRRDGECSTSSAVSDDALHLRGVADGVMSGEAIPHPPPPPPSAPRRHSSVFSWEYQASKALFDNMLNQAIESGSLPQFQVDEIIDCYNRRIEPAHNNHLEDEAVRMAIRSYGLQKHRVMSLVPSQQPQLHKHAGQSLPFRPRPSTSKSLQLEQDLLSDAVSVAIQSKGLGTSYSLR